MMYDYILAGREERYNTELRLLEKFKKPLMVLTINYPGPSKLDSTAVFIFRKAVKTIISFRFIYFISGKNPAGHYFMGVLQGDPLKIKRETVDIEEGHPLGRLFDIDVIDYPYRNISRERLKKEGRRCIVCGQDTKDCILMGRHTTAEVLEKINQMVEEYKWSMN
ncbi:MAG: citrate lyase holo-[acyl-carrier protein] synthase [Thermoanaerobacteraceae bacterium]|nr:citrate lyase holo-[acyl-carrier protein] synthase [Thermoanaerobacteraceae bacterium]